MKAILLAAGSGKRLGTLTKDTPKALIDINGQSLLERQIFALRKNEIDDIIVVTGPNRDKFKIPNVKYIHDIDYSNHDVLGTMMSVEEFMDDDVIISYTDIVFDEKIINSMKLSNQEINIAVEMDWEKGNLKIHLHNDVKDLQTSLVNSQEMRTKKEKLNQLIINEIAKLRIFKDYN